MKKKRASKVPSKDKKQKSFLPIGLALFALLLALDQYTKSYFLHYFTPGQSVNIFPGVWYTYVQNTGITWGLLQNTNALMIWLSVIIFGLLLFFYDKFETTLEKIAYTLLLTGLWGNLIDRALHGFVIDFIDLHWWPVFNIADAAISIGLILLIIEMWRKS